MYFLLNFCIANLCRLSFKCFISCHCIKFVWFIFCRLALTVAAYFCLLNLLKIFLSSLEYRGYLLNEFLILTFLKINSSCPNCSWYVYLLITVCRYRYKSSIKKLCASDSEASIHDLNATILLSCFKYDTSIFLLYLLIFEYRWSVCLIQTKIGKII